MPGDIVSTRTMPRGMVLSILAFFAVCGLLFHMSKGTSESTSYIEASGGTEGLAASGNVTYITADLQDGTQRYFQSLQNASPELLVLVLVEDAQAWGKQKSSNKRMRSINDLMKLLVGINLDLDTISLAISTGSEEEYTTIQRAVSQYPLGRATILYQKDAWGDDLVADRDAAVDPQLVRHSHIAKMRNRLMQSALQNETHMVWLDPDVIQMSPDLVQSMMQHGETDPHVGVIAVATYRGKVGGVSAADSSTYQLPSKQDRGPIEDANREAALANLIDTRKSLEDLKETAEDGLVPVDSVGASLLYIKSSLIWQGLGFPHFNIVGTTWGRSGWVGIDSEGLCYVAQMLRGGGCHALMGEHHAILGTARS